MKKSPDDYSKLYNNNKMTFKELNLKDDILSAIEELGYEQPMPVQEKAIPFMLEQTADLVALAQTGTGKTAAFGLPVLNMIDAGRKQVQALVLAPTRELCIQISNDLKGYSKTCVECALYLCMEAKIYAHNSVSWILLRKLLWQLPDG